MSEVSQISAQEWTVWRTFLTMRRQLDREIEHQLQHDADISGSDYEVLLTLFESPDRQLRVRELVEKLAWEKSRVSHQLTRMEKRGLVLRSECDTDARGTWVGITADGRRAVLGAMRDHATTIRRVFFDVVTDEERDTLLALSNRVLEALAPACEAVAAAGGAAGEARVTDE
jgi:DNA-binding MarR family transcriptional regulator